MNRIAQQIKNLMKEEKVPEAEALLTKLVSSDPNTIVELFPLLDDDCEYDEFIFSIIHTLETLEDNLYVQSYLNHVDSIFASSPRWTSILLIRIVNNTKTLSILRELLKQDSNKALTVNKVREYAKKIKRDMPSLV